MRADEVIRKYPDIKIEELLPHFPRLNMSDYPELRNYSWGDCHKGSMGAGDLFLASEMANMMKLKKGMRILDLGAGKCNSSIFLAKHYGMRVVAADLRVDPSDNWKRIKKAGVENYVVPIKMAARNIPFAEQYFDAVFSMNSYFYFGTDDLYLLYLTKFIKEHGKICIAGPCYSTELTKDTPKEFLYDPPDFKESYSCHSPGWWKNHFEKMDLVDVLFCEEHPKGREMWLDSVRWRIEDGHKLEDFKQDVIMLLSDKERFITYFTLLAEKR